MTVMKGEREEWREGEKRGRWMKGLERECKKLTERDVLESLRALTGGGLAACHL